MHMPRRHALCAGLLMTLSATACHGDHQRVYVDLASPHLMDAHFTQAQLQQDVDHLFDRVAALHPDLDSRLPPAQRERLRQTLRSQVRDGMDRRQFQRIVGTATEAFRDGHAGVFYPYPEFNRFGEQGGTVFPMTVTSRGGALFVAHDYSQSGALPTGTRLLAIDGMPVEQVLAGMARYTRGESPLLREQIAAREFSTLLWHYHDVAGPVTVRFQDGDDVADTTVAPMASTAFAQAVEARGSAGQDDVRYRTLDGGVGYLEVSYFGGDRKTFRHSVDQAIGTARADGVDDLIIDIRNNPGGSTDNVETLLSRISPRTCELVSSVTEKLNDVSASGWFAKGEAGELVALDMRFDVAPARESRRFPGKVYLMIGPYTYSAAIVMATAVQDCGVGTVIGEPTAGFANQTGQIFFFDLPNTRIRAFAPTRLLYRPNGERRTDVVRPDHVLPIAADGDGGEAASAASLARALAISLRTDR